MFLENKASIFWQRRQWSVFASQLDGTNCPVQLLRFCATLLTTAVPPTTKKQGPPGKVCFYPLQVWPSTRSIHQHNRCHLRVWLSKNHTLCMLPKKNFAKNVLAQNKFERLRWPWFLLLRNIEKYLPHPDTLWNWYQYYFRSPSIILI